MRGYLHRLVTGKLVPPITIDIVVAVIVAVFSYSFSSLQWAITYTLLASAVTLMLHMHFRIGQLPRRLTKHRVFKATTIAQDLMSILQREDPLFVKVALDKMREFQLVFTKLRNEEYTTLGDEVFNLYSGLITDLRRGDEYCATTYVDDTFWEEPGGIKFLNRNEKALRRGAIITRVFFYDSSAGKSGGGDLLKFQVVKKHLELKRKLDSSKHRKNLKLCAFDLSKADPLHKHVAEDKGIIKNRYVMFLSGDSRAKPKEATISISSQRVHDEWVRFTRLLNHPDLEHLDENLLGDKP